MAVIFLQVWAAYLTRARARAFDEKFPPRSFNNALIRSSFVWRLNTTKTIKRGGKDFYWH